MHCRRIKVRNPSRHSQTSCSQQPMMSNPNIREPRPKQHQNMQHAHHALFFGSTKECISETSFNMSGPGQHAVHNMSGYKRQPFCSCTTWKVQNRKIRKARRRLEVFWSWGRQDVIAWRIYVFYLWWCKYCWITYLNIYFMFILA